MPNSLKNYGQISPQQQLHFLNRLFNDIEKETQLSKLDRVYFIQIKSVLLRYNEEQVKQADLRHVIQDIKTIITRLEQYNKDSILLQQFQKYGIYRMFYHHSVTQGIDDTGLFMRILKNGFIGVGAAALITALFAITGLLGAPVWITVISSALFASAVTYLSALVYGVINDLFATKANLPYFLLGHQPAQHSLLRTNDPVAQGIAWGVAATFDPAVLASLVFGVATVITASLVPMASFIFPVMFIAMPLIAWGADVYAKRKAKHYAANGFQDISLELWEFGANDYQYQGLKLMSDSKEEKAAWLANSDRNMFGFTKLPLIGLGVLATAITLSAVHSVLPALLFSSLFATVMPVAFAAAAIVFLAAAGAYTYINREKQIDNRFKLNFAADADLDDKLYLDEDLLLVAQLSKDFKATAPQLEADKEPQHFANPLQQQRTNTVEVELAAHVAPTAP